MARTPSTERPYSDPELLSALRSGDPSALNQLMDQLWAPLVRYAARLLGGAGDPQDFAQEAFVRLWARRGKLREDGSLKALLYTTVRNACLDQFRTETRREKLQSTHGNLRSGRTPFEDVHGAELQRLAAAAVAKLPKKRQEVFRLIREEGFSYKETAQILDLSEQTVANHMSLAMADLRVAIRPFLGDGDQKSEGAAGSTVSGNPTEG